MPELNLFMRLGVALAIGLMVGLQRGWQSRDDEEHGRAAGFRTFGLTGLMGGVAGHLSTSLGPTFAGSVFLAFTAVFLAFHWLEAREKNTNSVTGVIAGMLTFLLGTLTVVSDVPTAIAAAVAMTVLLALRDPLHRWVASLTWEEIRAALILMVMSFLLLPVLPNRMIDSWGVINPHEIWLLAIMIALISFAGYAAVRIFGAQLGVIVTAAAGGLASSTATTLTFARLGRDHPAAVNLLAGGILISGSVMLVRVGIIAMALNQTLIQSLMWPLLAGAGVMGALALALIFLTGRRVGENSTPQLQIANPLVVSTSLKLAAFILLVIVAAELVQRNFGETGVRIVAAISGIADVDAITISMARLKSAPALATQSILIAVAVNTVSKAVMAAWVGGKPLGLRLFGASALALAAGGLTFVLTS